MTHRVDVASGRDVVARWCDLAEQRLEYLTVLFETGRWRRYHSEAAFLENIQEAKSAVEVWRGLSIREASPDNSAVDMSWLGRAKSALPRVDQHRDQLEWHSPPIQVAAEPLRSEATMTAEPVHVASDEAPSVPELDPPALDDVAEPTLDEIAQRYPLLRNAL